MAPSLRCPRCGTVVPAVAGQAPVCPACGFSGPAPAEATGSAPPPSRTSSPSPPSPSPSAAPQPSPSPPLQPLPPLPPSPGGGWAPGQAGKVVQPALVAVLTVVTLGIYSLFYWWRVSRETDALLATRRAHPITRAGILLNVAGGAVAIVLLVVILIGALAAAEGAEEGAFASEEELAEEVFAAALPFLALLLLAILAAAVGGILLLVGMYRSWDQLRRHEVAAGRPDPVNPPLYLFLPLGLSLAGGVLPYVGVLLSLASFVLTVAFMALTQRHLNDVWQGQAPGPAAPRGPAAQPSSGAPPWVPGAPPSGPS